MRTKLIENWKIMAVEMRAKGYYDKECAQRAGVSLEKLKTSLGKDDAFRADYERAGANAPKRPQW
jgi:hypothetical protein